MARTAKQQAFVAEYLKCWNASEAARRAGYTGDANTVGPRLLADVGIKAEIDQRKAELLMSADEVMVRLTEQGRAAYAPYIRPDGSVNMADLVLDGKAHLIKKIKPTKEGNEIEFYDAQTALAMIAKAHGLDRVTLTGPNGGPIQTEATQKLDLTKLSTEQLRTLRTLLAEAQPDDTADAG
jgi:hypothetical protein